jgi:signal transduction histidine kinase
VKLSRQNCSHPNEGIRILGDGRRTGIASQGLSDRELVSLTTQNALPILGDHIQLQQVILNLVVNGIDAMRNTNYAK